MLSKEFHRHVSSALLQEKHRKVYEEMYHACPTVVSAPATLLWSPTYAVGPGGIGIISKIPLRMYVGIEPRSEPGVTRGSVRFYVPERDEFQEGDLTKGDVLLLNMLEAVAKQYGGSGGARIWIVSEIPWYRGLNVDCLEGAALATAWLLHLGVVSPREVAEFVKLPSEKLAACAPFEKVFRLAWKLDSIIANWLSDAQITFATLIDSKYPVVYFREGDPFLFDHYRDYGIDHPSSYYNASDGLFFRGVRMDELFQLDPNLAWPIDMALLFTGEEGDSRFVYKTRGAFKVQLDEAASFSRKALANLVPETFRNIPKFLELGQEGPGQSAGMNLFKVYRETSVVQSMTVFKTMHDLFQYGAAPHVVRDFFNSQNICQHIMRLLGLSPLALSRPQTLLRMVGARHTDLGIGTRLIGPGNHGCILVLGPENTLAPIFNEALPLLAEENKKTVHCHWASWCDGNAAFEGARVEQYVEEGLYSAMTASASVTVRERNGKGTIETMLYTLDKWHSEREKFDLLLDGRENCILVRGEKLTSAQIHSTKQTLELFGQFFSKKVEELASADLPKSCYAADRNQMESKIVRPLVGVVKELTGKALGLEIHGGLGSNFKVQFRPDKMLRIGMVGKG